jgi:heme exporter protein D
VAAEPRRHRLRLASYDGRVDREVWSSFTHDPRDAQFHVIRASDQDRASVQQALSEAYAEGRLDRDEFDERSDAARTVRTLGDIQPLLQDLVAARPTSNLVPSSRADLEKVAQRHWQTKRREAAFSFLGASLVTTAIWFATSWGDGGFEPYFFWPAFVIAFTLLNLVRTVASRQDIVDGEVRRLERRREKELRRKNWPR